MKKYIWILFLLLFSCNGKQVPVQKEYRTDFTQQEKQLMNISREIIDHAYFAQFVSIDSAAIPKIRVIEPFYPDKKWRIYFGTNSRSRKVKEILNNPNTAMHYFDKSQLAYVSLYGHSKIINDSLLRTKYWKKAWKVYYPNKEKDYLLIEFVPDYMEIVNITKGFTGDSLTWRPHKVVLRN